MLSPVGDVECRMHWMLKERAHRLLFLSVTSFFGKVGSVSLSLWLIVFLFDTLKVTRWVSWCTVSDACLEFELESEDLDCRIISAMLVV